MNYAQAKEQLIAYCKQRLAEILERGEYIDEYDQYIYGMRDLDINVYYDSSDGKPYASVSVYNVDADGYTITDYSIYYINSDGAEVWNEAD